MAQVFNPEVDQYANYQLTVYAKDVNGNPVDLTNYTFKMTLQLTVGGTQDWSGYITNGTTGGFVTVNVPYSVTALYTRSPVGTIDLLATDPSNNAARWFQGTVYVNQGISHN